VSHTIIDSKADTIRDILSRVNRPTFLSLLAVTEPKLLKSCPFGQVRKVSKILGIANFRYANSVNNQRSREGLPADFESLPRRWGKRLVGCPLVEHQGKWYLEVKVEKVLKSAKYWADGKWISKEALEPFLPKRQESGRQGVENSIILRDYNLESIRKLKIGGREV
jgi:hypothetical protein